MVAMTQGFAGRARSLMERTSVHTLLYLLLPLAAVPRLWQMFADQGVFWPDEIFQTIEQAHRFAFGYGWLPWEFREGARSWVFPGLLGIVLKVASWVGLTKTGYGVVMVARTVMLGLGLLSVRLAMKLGERLGGIYGAALAGVFVALCPPLLVYGTRVMTETAAGPVILGAALLAMDRTAKRAALAGLLCALAIFLRYQNGIFGIAILAIYLFTRSWKAAFAFWVAVTLGGVAGGLLDWAVWGRPFHSFLVYVKFNLIEGQASRWGTAGFEYYPLTLRTSFGPAVWVVLIGFLLSFGRARILPIVCLVNLGLHTAIPHKELRFLVPMLPLVLALAGGGLGWALGGTRLKHALSPNRWLAIWQRTNPWVAGLFAVLVGVAFARRTQTITFAAMGQFIGGKEDGWAPWYHESGPSLAFWEAGKHEDLCGITAVGTPLVAVGGFSYLHKNVPMLGSMSSYDLAATNYLAAPALTVPPAGYSVVGAWHFKTPIHPRTDKKPLVPPDYDYVLFRREGGCTPPPPWWVPHFN